MNTFRTDPIKSSVEIKLAHLNKRAVELQRIEADNFMPAVLTLELTDVQTDGYKHARLRLPDGILDEFKVCFDELLHHARSALDYMAWEQAGINGYTGNLREVYFPFCRSEEEFQIFARKAQDSGKFNKDMINFIGRSTPWPNPKFLLWVVHKLSNMSKHRDFVAKSTSSFDSFIQNVTVEDPAPDPFEDRWDPDYDLVQGFTFIRLQPHGRIEIRSGGRFECMCKIILSKNLTAELDLPVIYVSDFGKWTAQTIEQVVNEYRALLNFSQKTGRWSQ